MTFFREAFWTPERIGELKTRLVNGESFSLIASEMGAKSRNAVAGIVNRLGLSESRPAKLPKPPKPPRLPNGWRVHQPMLPAEPSSAFRCSLLELGPMTCHYPIGDPGDEDFRFCGSPAAKFPGPYCAHHGKLCHRPARERDHSELVAIADKAA